MSNRLAMKPKAMYQGITSLDPRHRTQIVTHNRSKVFPNIVCKKTRKGSQIFPRRRYIPQRQPIIKAVFKYGYFFTNQQTEASKAIPSAQQIKKTLIAPPGAQKRDVKNTQTLTLKAREGEEKVSITLLRIGATT